MTAASYRSMMEQTADSHISAKYSGLVARCFRPIVSMPPSSSSLLKRQMHGQCEISGNNIILGSALCCHNLAGTGILAENTRHSLPYLHHCDLR